MVRALNDHRSGSVRAALSTTTLVLDGSSGDPDLDLIMSASKLDILARYTGAAAGAPEQKKKKKSRKEANNASFRIRDMDEDDGFVKKRRLADVEMEQEQMRLQMASGDMQVVDIEDVDAAQERIRGAAKLSSVRFF